MKSLIQEFDWSQSPLGPVEQWSPALRTMTSIMLANRFPLLLWWGPDQISLYNDAYRPILGLKHPHALGLPVRECWSEVWDEIRPLILTPLYGGPSTWSEDLELLLERRGFQEEAHFTVAYSPVPDDTAPNGIGGVLATVHEITLQVISERRNKILRALGSALIEAKTPEQACTIAAEVFSHYRKDVPFAEIFLLEGEARRVASSVETAKINGEFFATALKEGRPQLIELPDSDRLSNGTQALVIPIPSNLPNRFVGVLVVGITPHIFFDDSYHSFFQLATTQLSTAIANATAYELERARAEALAALDRAKTTFFGNVSHEFRTPLTLMLAPLEELLGDAHSSAHRENHEIIYRNALRLQKLVNSLLEFSRAEAGRLEARYESVDLGEVTTEIASAFRSLVERAGLSLTVKSDTSGSAVFVDRVLWERVVLNLLSNAFKFTFEGGIRVDLEGDSEHVLLTVSDTGVGISEEHLPRLFERFYRIDGQGGRTHEGSGIGLALVQEIVRLHGGTVTVRSSLGEGTTFTVSLRRGSRHLPQGRVFASPVNDGETSPIRESFLCEASTWLGGSEGEGIEGERCFNTETQSGRGEGLEFTESGERSILILVADDNADMRAYLGRLLRPLGTVMLVKDGREALEAVHRHKPELVVTDIMMPHIDGLALITSLRGDPSTRQLPIILLSARAGEEARIDGASTGADDYIVKPFSARELVARIRAQLELARQRRGFVDELLKSEAKFEALAAASVDVVYRMSPDWSELRHLVGRDFMANTEIPSRNWLQSYIHQEDQPQVLEAIRNAIERKGIFELEHRVRRVDGTLGWTHSRAVPLLDPQGEIVEWFGTATDVSARKQAEEASRLADFATLFSGSAVPTSIVRVSDDTYLDVNQRWLSLFGFKRHEVLGKTPAEISVWRNMEVRSALHEALRRGEVVEEKEVILRTRCGEELICLLSAQMIDFIGERSILSSVVDITELKRAEQSLREADRRKDGFLAALSHELRNPLAPLTNSLYVLDRVSPVSEEGRRAKVVIGRQIAHLSNLVNDLLDVTRITQGKVRLAKERLDLNRLVLRAVEDNRSLFDDGGVELRCDGLPGLFITADPTRITQVLGNLLQNCAKFTPRGGRAVVSLSVQGSVAQIEVADDGVGMSEDTLLHLFQPFAQAEQSLDRNTGGLGLGLALVKGLVELHEGEVWATSPGIDCGSLITIHLPLTHLKEGSRGENGF